MNGITTIHKVTPVLNDYNWFMNTGPGVTCQHGNFKSKNPCIEYTHRKDCMCGYIWHRLIYTWKLYVIFFCFFFLWPAYKGRKQNDPVKVYREESRFIPGKETKAIVEAKYQWVICDTSANIYNTYYKNGKVQKDFVSLRPYVTLACFFL